MLSAAQRSSTFNGGGSRPFARPSLDDGRGRSRRSRRSRGSPRGGFFARARKCERSGRAPTCPMPHWARLQSRKVDPWKNRKRINLWVRPAPLARRCGDVAPVDGEHAAGGALSEGEVDKSLTNISRADLTREQVGAEVGVDLQPARGLGGRLRRPGPSRGGRTGSQPGLRWLPALPGTTKRCVHSRTTVNCDQVEPRSVRKRPTYREFSDSS